MGDDTENLSLSRFVGLAEPARGAWRFVAHKGKRTAYSPVLDNDKLAFVRSLQVAVDAAQRAKVPTIGLPDPELAFRHTFPEVMTWLAEQGIDYPSAVQPFMAELLRGR